MSVLMWLAKKVAQGSMLLDHRSTHSSIYHLATIAISIFLILLSCVLALGFAYEWLRFYWEPWMALGILAAGTFMTGVFLIVIMQQARKRAHKSMAQAIAAPLINANNTLTLYVPQVLDMVKKSRWELLGLMLMLGIAYAQRDVKRTA